MDKKDLTRREFLKATGTGVVATTVGCSLLANGHADTGAKEEGFQEHGAQDVSFKLNGKQQTLKVPPRTTLLDALRQRLDVTGPKRVCDRGTCGACTVIKDGEPIYACLMLAVDAKGSEITTVEGLGTETSMSSVQKAFVEKDGLMCGFCTPGFVTAVHAVLAKNPNATMDEIKAGCRGNICRCGTFNRVFEAAVAAARGAK
jgi:xanthine dehydrogenase YagT iron-sulfur-binding subunit